MEELRPRLVSFHFGLPDPALLAPVSASGAEMPDRRPPPRSTKRAGWRRMACDAIIAQGAEAGGHRGSFLSADITTQGWQWRLFPKWSTP